MRQYTIVIALLAAKEAFPSLATAQAGEHRTDPQLKQVLADWQERQHIARAVRYVLDGTGTVAKGTYSGLIFLPAPIQKAPVPDKDYTFPRKTTWLIDFEHNRLRKESDEETFRPDEGLFRPFQCVQVFDGSVTKRHLPKETNPRPAPDPRTPELGWVTHQNTISYDPTDYPIFLAHGVVGLSRLFTTPPFPEKVRVQPDAAALRVLEKRMLGDRECVVLRYTPTAEAPSTFEELWVDPARKSAVLRMEYKSGPQPVRIDVRYDATGLAPTDWTVMVFRNDKGEVYSSERMRVTERTVDPELSPSNFDIPLKPGMVVRKADGASTLERNYGARSYRVDSDGKTLVPVEESGTPRRGILSWQTALTATVALVTIGAVILLWRRKNRASGAP